MLRFVKSMCAKSTFHTTYEELWDAMLSPVSRLWIVRLLTSWPVSQLEVVDSALAAAVKQTAVSVVR